MDNYNNGLTYFFIYIVLSKYYKGIWKIKVLKAGVKTVFKGQKNNDQYNY